MIKVNSIKKTKTIKFPEEGLLKPEYAGKAFESIRVIVDNGKFRLRIETDHEEGLDAFIDWYKPNWENGHNLNARLVTEITTDLTEIERNEEWDTSFMGRLFTRSIRDYVEQKILQKLHIHRAELLYPFENTEDIGIPYLDKPSKEVLDLFIKEAIVETIGVKEVLEFNSRLDKDEVRGLKYYLEILVLAENDESVNFSLNI